MSRLLKTSFGNRCSAHSAGYTLSFLIGYLEALAHDEEDTIGDAMGSGQRTKRYGLVCDAIDLLNQACEMGGEQ